MKVSASRPCGAFCFLVPERDLFFFPLNLRRKSPHSSRARVGSVKRQDSEQAKGKSQQRQKPRWTRLSFFRARVGLRVEVSKKKLKARVAVEVRRALYAAFLNRLAGFPTQSRISQM
jgi:hypothetical protein